MDIRIEWAYRSPKKLETVFRSEEMPAAEGLLIAEDLERTGRAKTILFTDRHGGSWTMKELKGYLKGIESEPHNVTVYFDGGYDLSTGNAGLGGVIYYEQNGKSYRLRRNAAVSGLASNNEAEYAALHLCLQELDLLGVHHLPVRFIGDSNVVIKQMSGDWPVLEEDIIGWADRIDGKLEALGITPEYVLIGRKENAEADRLATQALNGVNITGTIELPSGS